MSVGLLSALANRHTASPPSLQHSIPGRLWALRLKSREQWAADWVSIKKTVKHEAQHYWVRGCALALASAVDLRVHGVRQLLLS